MQLGDMERAVLSKTHLSVLLFIAACGSAHHEPTTFGGGGTAAAPASGAQLSEETVQFSTAVIQALNDDAKEPPASNSYSHQKLLGPRKRLGEPQVQLEAT
ncbi:MAG: hypothetical protein WCB63_12475, partial [Polyangiales bacterium]